MVELTIQEEIDELGTFRFAIYLLTGIGALNWFFVSGVAGGLLGSYASGVAPTAYLVIGVAGGLDLLMLTTDISIGDMADGED